MDEDCIRETGDRQSVYDRAGWMDYFRESRSVLLVIDPQNDVLDEKGSLSFWQVWKHARENGAIGNVKRIITACRGVGIPVIWAKQYRLAEGRDVFPGTWDGDSLTLVRTLLPNAFMQDTWETEIYGDLAPMIDSKDIVIGKHGSNMFEGSALEKYLKNLGVKTLLVTGFLTDFCVEATVRSAADKGYLPVTIRDACATENENLHERSLDRMERLVGPTIDTDGLLALLKTRRVKPLPHAPRKYDLAEIGKSLAEGISLNEIVEWEKYLDRGATALLVIDPQNDRLDMKGSLSKTCSWKHAQKTGAVENIAAIASVCREKRIPIFWTRHDRSSEGRDIFLGAFHEKTMKAAHSANPGPSVDRAWDGAFFDPIKPAISPGDSIIEKTAHSALEATALQRYLTLLGVTNLIICGFTTDGGVEATARSASDRGYFSLIVSDACAAASEEDHQAALGRFDRLIGPVVTTKRIMEFLKEG